VPLGMYLGHITAIENGVAELKGLGGKKLFIAITDLQMR
jgi:hypothetical protein